MIVYDYKTDMNRVFKPITLETVNKQGVREITGKIVNFVKADKVVDTTAQFNTTEHRWEINISVVKGKVTTKKKK